MTPLRNWLRTKKIGCLYFLSFAICFAFTTQALAELPIDITISHRDPCNLFSADESVHFDATLHSAKNYLGTVNASVVDYFGHEVWSKSQPATLHANKDIAVPLNISTLPPGYYELTLSFLNDDEQDKAVEHTTCFGVAHFVNRTVDDVIKNDYRFGLKMWYRGRSLKYGKNKSKRLDFDERQVAEASVKLGLQWTRAKLGQTQELATTDLARDFETHVIINVDRYPLSCWDVERYGPYDEWTKKNGRYGTMKAVPQKEAYQQWIRQEVASIPSHQRVFEIWNEPWGKMTPEDFATTCQYATQAILEMRPDAIIGANLRGIASNYKFDGRFINAGGMNGMKMVALHPYNIDLWHNGRQRLRDYHQWIEEKVGRPIDLYTTEFGKHSTPQGAAKATEHEQAQSVLRQALILYAENFKALVPHTVGQTENDPSDRQAWYGFVRIPHEPKPVLMAYANAAYLIDGSTYIGDLWFGPNVWAMVFQRDGRYVMALWTTDENPFQLNVETGTDHVTLVDMVGKSSVPLVVNGKVNVMVSQDITYVVGLAASAVQEATKELNPKRWPATKKASTRHSRTIHQLVNPPKIDGIITSTDDGHVEEWANSTRIVMQRSGISPRDGSGIGYVGWDTQYLYVGVDIKDNKILNTVKGPKLFQEDCFELFISTEPRDDDEGYGPYDRYFLMTVTNGDGQSVLYNVIEHSPIKVAPVEGAQFKAIETEEGWALEVALPWSSFKDFEAKPGAIAAMEMRIIDADIPGSRSRRSYNPVQEHINMSGPTTWSLMRLEE